MYNHQQRSTTQLCSKRPILDSFVIVWHISYFSTSKPSIKDLEEPDDVYDLTPTTWNPHSDAYDINEESMLDWEGHMKMQGIMRKKWYWKKSHDETMISSLVLCEKEEKIISSNFVNDQDDQDEDTSTVQGFEDEMQLYKVMKLRTEHGQFAMNIGATNILDQAYLDDDDNDSQASNDTDENSMDDPEAESELMDLEEDDLEKFNGFNCTSRKPRVIDPRHLSKIWRISHEDAKNTIDVTTQASI